MEGPAPPGVELSDATVASASAVSLACNLLRSSHTARCWRSRTHDPYYLMSASSSATSSIGRTLVAQNLSPHPLPPSYFFFSFFIKLGGCGHFYFSDRPLVKSNVLFVQPCLSCGPIPKCSTILLTVKIHALHARSPHIRSIRVDKNEGK